MTMDSFNKPRSSIGAKLTREREPYHFQRPIASLHSNFPRPAQPNTSQPNAIIRPKATKQQDYWNNYSKQYLQRRGIQ